MTDPTLAPTALLDSDHPAVDAFALEHARGADDRERAVALYYAVRDGFRYDPYRIEMTVHGLRASTVLANGYGWCVPKAALLAAACRAAGIRARVGYADVRNHLSTARLRELMQTDIYHWHGYVDVWLDGQWFKATPAFNIELTERFGLLPLDFDGRSDSIYLPYDKAGHKHMEYVRQHGAFDDMPLERIIADNLREHPRWLADTATTKAGDFLADVERETR